MEAAHTSAPGKQETPSQDNERRCLATGEMLAKTDMVRFVVSPDNDIVPDLAQNLPGRGMWVKADMAAITLAATKGLFSKAAKISLKANPDLAQLTQALLRARCLSLVGLAKGAGISVLGETQVQTELRANRLALLLRASDAKAQLDSREKITIYNQLTRDELGAALGYAQIVYAGFKAHGLTARLQAELSRLKKLIDTSHMNDQTQAENG